MAALYSDRMFHMSEPVSSRFVEHAQEPWGDHTRYLVRCPKCARIASVSLVEVSGHARWDARAVCVHCGFNQSVRYDGPQRRGPVFLTVDGRCGNCGGRLSWRRTRVSGGPGHPPVVFVTCRGCGARNRRAASWRPKDAPEERDDYFGLPLWLQTECCGRVLWARNEGHLLFLERYVGAQLRERAPNRNGSLASRLPSWMKQGKNRDEVLACLARLRRSLTDA
jgi:hypothetical protein